MKIAFIGDSLFSVIPGRSPVDYAATSLYGRAEIRRFGGPGKGLCDVVPQSAEITRWGPQLVVVGSGGFEMLSADSTRQRLRGTLASLHLLRSSRDLPPPNAGSVTGAHSRPSIARSLIRRTILAFLPCRTNYPRDDLLRVYSNFVVQVLTETTAVVVLLVPFGGSRRTYDYDQRGLLELRRLMLRIQARHPQRVVVVDARRALRGKRDFLPDGVHLNDSGRRRVALVLADAIRSFCDIPGTP